MLLNVLQHQPDLDLCGAVLPDLRQASVIRTMVIDIVPGAQKRDGDPHHIYFFLFQTGKDLSQFL